MARPIKETPILFGEDARRFEVRMNQKRTVPQEEIDQIKKSYDIVMKWFENGKKYAYFARQTRGDEMSIVSEKEISQDEIYLKIEYRFSKIDENGIITSEDQARFYYSLDGENWVKIGKGFTMSYSLDLFTGYRTALYCYSTIAEGGHADFDYYHTTKGER